MRGKHFWPRFKAKDRALIIEAVRQNITQEMIVSRVKEMGIGLSKTQASRIFQGQYECSEPVAEGIAKVLGKKPRQLFHVLERPSLIDQNAA